MTEVMVCKFDNKVQCVNYACEEDISSLEVTKMACALHARIENAVKLLDQLMTPNRDGVYRFPSPDALWQIRNVLKSDKVKAWIK